MEKKNKFIKKLRRTSDKMEKKFNQLEEQENKTCLVVSHRKAAFKMADNIIVPKDGKIEAPGTLDYLLANSPEILKLWSEDFNGG